MHGPNILPIFRGPFCLFLTGLPTNTGRSRQLHALTTGIQWAGNSVTAGAILARSQGPGAVLTILSTEFNKRTHECDVIIRSITHNLRKKCRQKTVSKMGRRGFGHKKLRYDFVRGENGREFARGATKKNLGVV